MATIVGAVATSHIPAIGKAIARNLQHDPYWQPFFSGFARVHEWLAKVKPDVALVVYNDHGLNFFMDKMPTFAVGAARQYINADEGWGIPSLTPFPGDPKLSWHIIESLMEDEFDVTTCQEMLVDHGFALPMALLWPGGGPWPVAAVPVSINTVQHPLPTPARCYKLGQALGRAIASYDEDVRVVVVGTGGLSHQLDGLRAGFINKEFDLLCMDKIVSDPETLTQYSVPQLVELAGSQGVELMNWIIARATLGADVERVHANYHIPISNTAAGTLVLQPRA